MICLVLGGGLALSSPDNTPEIPFPEPLYRPMGCFQSRPATEPDPIPTPPVATGGVTPQQPPTSCIGVREESTPPRRQRTTSLPVSRRTPYREVDARKRVASIRRPTPQPPQDEEGSKASSSHPEVDRQRTKSASVPNGRMRSHSRPPVPGLPNAGAGSSRG
ncbi:hypothetical protein BJV74DRAFT_798338 [Russula compacta]|nr:hypothetical protein BJV74DRAFT_798338 [Russula compacta]